jgi:hypothetical protein
MMGAVHAIVRALVADQREVGVRWASFRAAPAWRQMRLHGISERQPFDQRGRSHDGQVADVTYDVVKRRSEPT